jgi:beta-xylosidase
MPVARTRLLVGSVLGLAMLLSLLASGELPASARTERAARTGNDPFTAGATYHGAFADPTVWRVGRRFYAASTTVASLNLPTMTSTDLRTWTARRASDPAKPRYNDALPTPARWAKTQQTAGGRAWASTWAPSVLRISTGTFVAAYSVPRASDGRRCISLARSATPMGPYVDSSAAPLSCGAVGEIDPQLFVNRGAIWMAYKSAGSSPRLLVRPMNKYATGFVLGSRIHILLVPRKAWEGSVVENPAMIRYRKRLYLFYSANDWWTSRYATGYAVCRTVIGPCKRKSRILFTGRYLAGPGGAAPFVDLAGQLRLAFHAWRIGDSSSQRRMYIAALGVRKHGRLQVRSWF